MAPAGTIQIVDYPHRNEQQPGQMIFVWPAALKLDTRGEVLYQAGCVYALTSREVAGDAVMAEAYLAQAISEGFGRAFIDKDNDLAALRGRDSFKELVAAAKTLRQRR